MVDGNKRASRFNSLRCYDQRERIEQNRVSPFYLKHISCGSVGSLLTSSVGVNRFISFLLSPRISDTQSIGEYLRRLYIGRSSQGDRSFFIQGYGNENRLMRPSDDGVVVKT